MENYRKKFKKYYGVDFGCKYDIHHLDLNHNNNDISNLMILPRELHNKFHFLRNECEKVFPMINFEITGSMLNFNNYSMEMVEELIKTLKECNKWYDYKLFLDNKLPNIHKITLEV